MSLTRDELAAIRERANLQCGLDGDDADELLIEVDRLRRLVGPKHYKPLPEAPSEADIQALRELLGSEQKDEP